VGSLIVQALHFDIS